MDKIRSFTNVLKQYYFILTPSQKRWGVVVMILTLIGSIFETLGISIILPLVQVMIDPQQLRKNEVIAPVIRSLNLDSDAALMWGVGGAVILIYLVKNLFLLFLSYVRVKYACKIQRELSVEMIESYMKRGYVFFLNVSTGELLRGMREGIDYTYQSLYQLFKLLAETSTMVFICIYIMLSDFTMAISVILLALICLLVVILGCQKWVKKSAEVYYKYAALVNKSLLQTFQGIKEILVMRRQKYFIDFYKSNYLKLQKGYIGQTVAVESPAYIIEGICVMGLIIAVCFKAIGAGDMASLVPQLASFAVAAFRILPSLGRISSSFNQFMFGVPSITGTYNNFKEVRKEEAVVKKSERIYEDNIRRGFRDTISIKDIVWRYPDAEENVLENISLDIKKGESIAFIGKSGAGKSTLADIVLGLLLPQQGRVMIDGVDITQIPEQRSRIMGYVPQNINLLDDTVRRNVAFGIPDDEIDDDLVWKALEEAQLKDTVVSYESGLDTEIGERGIRFSGGQRQRFAIARALYCDPDILILDEATSALDTETETAIMEAIEALQGQKTLIIIAHRYTTIKGCDRIYEIANGKILERQYQDLI